MAVLIRVRNTKGLLLLSLLLLSIVGSSLAEYESSSSYGLGGNVVQRILKKGKTSKSEKSFKKGKAEKSDDDSVSSDSFSAKGSKKGTKSGKKGAKKGKGSKKGKGGSGSSSDDVAPTLPPTQAPTESPTFFPTTTFQPTMTFFPTIPTTSFPTNLVVSGCYMSKSVRDAGYENGVCDCEMTEEACNAEEKDGRFPIWSGSCAGLCMCPATGFGCYSNGACDCSDNACEGGERACEADGKFWTNRCSSCQCPDAINTDCNPNPKPGSPTETPTVEPEPVEQVFGCYMSKSVSDAGYANGVCDCEMTEEACNAEEKAGPFPIWSGSCAGLCLCSDTINTDCKPNPKPGSPTETPSVEPEPAEPVSGCYMSKSVRDAGYENGVCDCEMTEEACNAEEKDGRFPIWSSRCTGLCMCPATGFGCYSTPACDCSDQACEGGQEVCEADGGMWLDQCRSCQCPSAINTDCKPNPKPDDPDGDDDDDDDESGCGCYSNQACDCSESVCSATTCGATGGFWTGACTSCSCPNPVSC